jgi:DNA-3-methyladenine glycosylase I
MVEYHDKEWGVPLHDDTQLFEFLVLEGAQAGLSWSTILHKRAGYRRAFEGFDPEKVARLGKGRVERLLSDPGIVRNRRKVEAAVTNAKAFLVVQVEFGSFDRYLWSFVDGSPIRNDWSEDGVSSRAEAAAKRLSSDLRARGFKFVGPTICYAFMQAVGMVNDHTIDCFRHAEIRRLSESVI